jgi:pimeloyl-ACP methyl ester carboxylesterase
MTAQLDSTPPEARLSDVELPEVNPESDRWPGRKVRVVGVDIHVRTAPGPEGAERALLIHGLGGAATNWTDFGALLSSQLEVEAIDLPGFGLSSPSLDGTYSIAMQAATVMAYLDESKRAPAGAPGAWRGPVHLVGNSMGGLIALQVAALRPDLVRTLTLISPAVPDIHTLRSQPLKNDWRMALIVVPGLGEYGVRRLARSGIEARVRGTLNVCFADPARYPEQRLAQDMQDVGVRLTEQPWANKALLKATRALVRVQYFQRRVTWNRMAKVVAPTLVLWGDTDRLVAPELAQHVAAAIPGAHVRVFENTGHTAMMERPVESARAFFALLEDVAAGEFAKPDDVSASAIVPR